MRSACICSATCFSRWAKVCTTCQEQASGRGAAGALRLPASSAVCWVSGIATLSTGKIIRARRWPDPKLRPVTHRVRLRCSCNCCFAGGNEAAAGRFGANAPASLALADNVHPGDNHEGWARLGKGHLGRREKLRQTFNAPARDFQNSATARHERVSPWPNCVRNGEARLRRAFVPPCGAPRFCPHLPRAHALGFYFARCAG